MTLLILFFVGTSLLMLGLSVPLIRGRINPNHWYGFRIPLTLNNPDIWYPANRYAGWLLLIYGLVLLAVSLGLPFLLGGLMEESAMSIYGLSVAAVMLVGLVPIVILSFRYAHKVAKDYEADDSPYVQTIRRAHPDLVIGSVELNDRGQNSVVLVVDGDWIFRFPRYAHVLARLRVETAILQAIQDRVPLDVPAPVFLHLDGQEPGGAFVGYRRIPGEPLWRDTFRALDDEATVDRLAQQLAGFLRTLHAVPPGAIPAEMTRCDTHAEWADIYARMRDRLLPHMRPDARAWVVGHFEAYLDDEQAFAYVPVLKHGDFGPSNILYDRDARRITGILDFGNSGLGDPAYDFAGLLSGYGEDFVRRCAQTYPQVEVLLPRIHFYRGTFALLEALFGAENDDPAAYAAGMASYV